MECFTEETRLPQRGYSDPWDDDDAVIVIVNKQYKQIN